MPRIHSVDGDLGRINELLPKVDEYLKERGLKSFSFALVESVKETVLVKYGKLFEGGGMQASGIRFEDFTRGRLFGEDAEFRWEPRYPAYTFLFFVNDEGPDNIDGFARHEDIHGSSCLKQLYLWGEYKDGKYKDARVPQDLVYPLKDRYVTVVLEEYWENWCCISSRFRTLEGQDEKELQKEGS